MVSKIYWIMSYACQMRENYEEAEVNGGQIQIFISACPLKIYLTKMNSAINEHNSLVINYQNKDK